jgi:hypothetical protein
MRASMLSFGFLIFQGFFTAAARTVRTSGRAVKQPYAAEIMPDDTGERHPALGT